MAQKEGACACCETPVPFTGRIPILCQSCRTAREQMISGGGVTQLASGGNLNTRLLLPDSELVPKGVTLAIFTGMARN